MMDLLRLLIAPLTEPYLLRTDAEFGYSGIEPAESRFEIGKEVDYNHIQYIAYWTLQTQARTNKIQCRCGALFVPSVPWIGI